MRERRGGEQQWATAKDISWLRAKAKILTPSDKERGRVTDPQIMPLCFNRVRPPLHYLNDGCNYKLYLENPLSIPSIG